jgi:hypothetical protein
VNADSNLVNAPSAPPRPPVIDKPYWVQCKNYRCLAFFNKEGKWQSLSTGKEVTDIVKIYFEED